MTTVSTVEPLQIAAWPLPSATPWAMNVSVWRRWRMTGSQSKRWFSSSTARRIHLCSPVRRSKTPSPPRGGRHSWQVKCSTCKSLMSFLGVDSYPVGTQKQTHGKNPDLLDRAGGLLQQITASLGIVHPRFSQHHRLNPLGCFVDAQRQLAPSAAFGDPMLGTFHSPSP